MQFNNIGYANKLIGVCVNHKMALVAAAVSLALTPVSYAQEAETQASTIEVKNKSGEIEVIEVKGMRGTMTRSLNEKKNSSAIVDALAAADFGELPGLSISDIIENISGASGHRLKGSQNEISIRGLGSYWGYSTFNGRTITNAGPGRAVNFKKFPSELVDKVVIYKSQQADLVEGGTSGTIEVNSLRALDYGKRKTTIEASGIYNDYYSDVDGEDVSPWGGQLVLSTVQQFETDDMGDFGFTFGVVHSDSSNPEENYGGSSQMRICATRLADGTPLSDDGRDCEDRDWDEFRSGDVDDDGILIGQGISDGRVGRNPSTADEDFNLSDYDPSSIFYVPGDAFWRTGEDEDKRTNYVATFQWQPNERWDINADVEISRLEYTEKRMELGLDSRRDRLTGHIIGDDYTLLYAEGKAKPQLSGENRNQVDDYDGGGLSITYLPSDDLTLTADLSYSKSYRYRLRHRSKVRTSGHHDYSLDFRQSDVPILTFLGEDPFDPTHIDSFTQGQMYLETRRSHDEREDDILAFRFDAEQMLEGDIFSSVKAGFRYSEEHLLDFKTNDVSLNIDDGSKQNGSSDTDDSGAGNKDWADGTPEEHAALVDNVVNNCLNDHNNSHLFSEESGSGGDANQFVTYDALCMIGYYNAAARGDTNYAFSDIGEREDGRNGSDVDVDENIFAAYVMANIDSNLGGIPVSGNIGLRWIRNETVSRGWGDAVSVVQNADGTFGITNTAGSRVNLESEYSEFLPSINLSFQLDDEWILRAAAYRAISRFQMNAMSSGVSIETCDDVDESNCDTGSNTDINEVVQTATVSGNHMDPYTSANYDLSLEYYPSHDMAVTLALYWKDFTGGFEDVTVPRAIPIEVQGGETQTVFLDVLTKQTSEDDSTIKGFEFTAQKHFTELPEPWNGLGAKFSYNWADSDFVSPEVASPGLVPDANLFGFSKQVASTSVYWEGEDLTLRLLYKYRSKYFQPNSLPFPDRSHRYVQDSGYLDASAKYKINDTFSVSLKALNLLNEPQIMTRGNDTTIADYSRSGTKFLLGVKAKF